MPLDTSIVLAKVEDVYATDAAPTPAADAQVVYDWNPRPQMFDELRRPVERGFAGATPKIKTRGRQGHALKVELTGSGVKDQATRWGSVWLRACMFDAPAITAATEVSYPLGTVGDGASLTFWGYKDNVRHRTQGWRSNAKFVFNAGEFPYIEIDGMGLLKNDPDGSAVGSAPVYPAYPTPLEINTANTSFSLGGFSPLLRSIEIDLRMKTSYRHLVGQEVVRFDKNEDGDRRAIGGTMVIELPDPTVKSYLADVRNRTNLPMSLTHGTVEGNIIELGTTVLNLDEPSWSVEANRIMATMAFDLVPSAAGNELTLKTR